MCRECDSTQGDDMADKESVQKTPEGAYVAALQWEFDGHRYVCRGVSEPVKDKLKEVFEKWRIGFDCDKVDCKPNTLNVNVTKRQFQRVEFVPDKVKLKGATSENL